MIGMRFIMRLTQTYIEVNLLVTNMLSTLLWIRFLVIYTDLRILKCMVTKVDRDNKTICHSHLLK
jgi:hypothetical protein